MALEVHTSCLLLLLFKTLQRGTTLILGKKDVVPRETPPTPVTSSAVFILTTCCHLGLVFYQLRFNQDLDDFMLIGLLQTPPPNGH